MAQIAREYNYLLGKKGQLAEIAEGEMIQIACEYYYQLGQECWLVEISDNVLLHLIRM